MSIILLELTLWRKFKGEHTHDERSQKNNESRREETPEDRTQQLLQKLRKQQGNGAQIRHQLVQTMLQTVCPDDGIQEVQLMEE